MEKLDMIYNDLQTAKKDIKSILQRVSKVEIKATLWGGFGGAVMIALIKGFFK